MSKATDKLKCTVVRVFGEEQAKRVWKMYKQMGFRTVTNCRDWSSHDSFYSYAERLSGATIFVNPQNRCSYGTDSHYDHHRYDERPATVEEVEAIFAEHQEEKRAMRRDSRLRKKGWIKNTGEKPSGNVDLLFVTGFNLNQPPENWYWDVGRAFSIQYYRPHKEEENMKSKWIKWEATSYSVSPVTPDTTVEVVLTHSKRTVKAGELSWHKLPFSTIRKYRVIKEAVKPEGKTISLEDMVTKVATDLGKNVAKVDNGTGLYVGGIVPRADTTVVATAETNPKKQFGDKSIPLNLWSPLASSYGAVSLYCGSLKYGRGNYKATPVEASIYIAAAIRHLLAWAEGEEYDPADGCPNLGGVLANIAILLDARAVGTLIDDRQISGGYLKERDNLKEIIKSLQELHGDKDPRHYTIADNK